MKKKINKLRKKKDRTIVLINDEKEEKLALKIKPSLIVTTVRSLKEKYFYIDIDQKKNEEKKMKETRLFFERIKRKVTKEEYDEKYFPHINTFYTRISCPLLNIVCELEKIINDNEIEKIVFLGGNKTKEHLHFNFGEGESPAKQYYNRSDFFNYYITQRFNNKKIIFYKQSLTLKLTVKKIITRNILKYYFIFKKLRSKVGVISKKDYNTKKKRIVFSIRTKNHYDCLQPLYREFEKIKDKVDLFCLKEQNFTTLKLNNKGYELEEILTVKDYILMLNKSKNKSKNKNKNIFIKLEGININLFELDQEMDVYTFDHNLRKRAFKKILKKGDLLINSETNNHRGAFDYLYLKTLNVKTYVIQSVLMGSYKLPHYCWGETVFCWDKNTAEQLSKINNSNKFKYKGPLIYDDLFNTFCKSTKTKLKFCIFTQPDRYEKSYYAFISNMVKAKLENVEILLKLHPRDNIINYKELLPYVRVIKGSSIQVLSKIDLAISIHSSVLNEAIMKGVPALTFHEKESEFILYSKEINYLKYCYVLIGSEKLKEKLNYEVIYKEFKKRRLEFLKKNHPTYKGYASETILKEVL